MKFVAYAVALLLLTGATAIPQPKDGQCPGSWITSGSYCIPPPGMDRPRAAFPKGAGQCPSGYAQSGNYCEEIR